MKKGVMGNLLFASILLVFLSSGIFALDAGTCGVTSRLICESSEGHNIIMGLSSATNAHGEFPYINYPFVLCCAFGTGDTTTCRTDSTKKMIGLSSSTNAHAEAPLQPNYLTSVCYEDVECISTLSNCGTSDALDYRLNFSSLSSLTNAHIGAIDDFPIKICCKSAKFLSPCTLKSASWNMPEAESDNEDYKQPVRLDIVGSGPECDSQTVAFEVSGGSSPVTRNPVSVNFNGDITTGIWYAEHQTGCGLLGLSDCSYYFNVSLVRSIPPRSMISSDPKLLVKKVSAEEECASITTCDDYNAEEKCEGDKNLCNVAKDSSLPEVDCSNPKILCRCSWDTETSECGFGYSEVTPGLCDSGTTLCQDSQGINYCYPGNCSDVGGTAPSDSDGICDVDDSCASSDCENGDSGSCVLGATCLDEMCYSATATPKNATCNYHFTLCRTTLGINYCYPGNECPGGAAGIPPSNGNLKCDVGEGCLSTDCEDGDQDSCSNETYCVLGMCSSVEGPIDLPDFGGCKIDQTIIKNCDEEPVGYKTVKWSGTWSIPTQTSGDAYNRCIAGGTSNIPCPAQVQLPFFGYWGIAITIIIIALVYFFLISKKKKFFKRKKKQNR